MEKDIAPGSLADRLNVHKSLEWMESYADRAKEIFAENPNEFSSIIHSILLRNGVPPIVQIPLVREAGMAATEVAIYFFIYGMMKGVCLEEERAKLESMMHKE